MIKIIKSNKIYLKPPEELLKLLEKQFTFEIYEHPQQQYPKIIRQINKISDEVYCIERGALNFITTWLNENGFEYTIVDKTVSVPTALPKMLLPPREDQLEIINAFLETGIINGSPGYGKTAAAIAIASRLQERTLVVCTTTAIRDNWVGEIKKFLGITAGILGSGNKISDAPIVVGNYQTVKLLANKINRDFGLIIIDEMHHTPAVSFTNILSSSAARYRLGLSGTLKRKDGLQVVFPGLFGTTIFKPVNTNIVDPVIIRIPIPVELSGNSQIPWANRINDLYNNPDYKLTIAYIVSQLEAAGHKTLVTADRVEFIKDLHNAVSDNTSRLFIGESDTEDRDKYLKDILTNKANKVFASTNLFSEGISCNPLSALVHTGSTNNESLIYQLIGRIQRIVVGKPTPIYIDLCLAGSAGKKHARERKALYLVKGWKVIELNSLEDLNKTLRDTSKV